MKDIKQLVELKKGTISTDEDKEKLEVIEELLLEESSFFELDSDTIFGILEFLGVSEEEMMDYYNSLLSYDKFKNIPNVRFLDESVEKGR